MSSVTKHEAKQALLQRVSAGADLMGLEEDAKRLMRALDVVEAWPEVSTQGPGGIPSSDGGTQ